jgi:phage major head subunit gpT-like protein
VFEEIEDLTKYKLDHLTTQCYLFFFFFDRGIPGCPLVDGTADYSMLPLELMPASLLSIY